MTLTTNLFEWGNSVHTEEITEQLLRRKDVRVERILSGGHASPIDFWYDQDEDEWVAVLQGSAALQWSDGSITELVAGNWLLIPAHTKHRVERTSLTPACVWLAIFLPPA